MGFTRLFLFEALVFLVLIFFLVTLSTNNIVVWWSVFVLMTLIFVLLCKSSTNFSSTVNYFVLQEVLGLFFLVVDDLEVDYFQFFVLLMKVGVAPLHFWIFSVTSSLSGWVLMWFLTFQKLPFFPVILQLCDFKFIFIFLLGVLFCFVQLFSLKGYKNMVVLSSTESFNWILLTMFGSVLNSLYLFLYYFVIMIFLIPYFSSKFSSLIDWETLLVFLNIPFSVSFFIKIFSLGQIFFLTDIFLLVLLFFMFLPALSLSLWLVNMSVKNFSGGGGNLKSMFFFIFPLMLVSLV